MNQNRERLLEPSENLEPGTSAERVQGVRDELARRNLLPRLEAAYEAAYQSGHRHNQIPLFRDTPSTLEMKRIEQLIKAVKKFERGLAPAGMPYPRVLETIALIDEEHASFRDPFMETRESATLPFAPVPEFPEGHSVWKDHYGTIEETAALEYPEGHPAWEAYGSAEGASVPEYPEGHPAWDAYGVGPHWPFDSVEGHTVPKDFIAFLRNASEEEGLVEFPLSAEKAKRHLDAVTHNYIAAMLTGEEPDRIDLEKRLRDAFREYKEALDAEGAGVSSKDALVEEYLTELEESTNAHPSAGMVRSALRSILSAIALLGLAAVAGNEAGNGTLSFSSTAEASQRDAADPRQETITSVPYAASAEDPSDVVEPSTATEGFASLEGTPEPVIVEELPERGLEPPDANTVLPLEVEGPTL